MSKYKFHYQQIKHTSDKNDPYKVHEAYSQGASVIMINPKPIQLTASSKEELEELISMVERDVVKYGVLTIKESQRAMQAYEDFISADSVPAEPIFYHDEEDYEDEEDYHDDDDKVIPIDEYFKRTR